MPLLATQAGYALTMTAAFNPNKTLRAINNQMSGPQANCQTGGITSTSLLNHFDAIRKIVRASTSRGRCQRAVTNYYRQKSMWKDFSKTQRIQFIAQSAMELEKKLRNEGIIKNCQQSIRDIEQIRAKKLIDKMVKKIFSAAYKADKKYDYKSGQRLPSKHFLKYYDDLREIFNRFMRDQFFEAYAPNVPKTFTPLPSGKKVRSRIYQEFWSYTSFHRKTVESKIKEEIYKYFEPFIELNIKRATQKVEPGVALISDKQRKIVGPQMMNGACYEIVKKLHDNRSNKIKFSANTLKMLKKKSSKSLGRYSSFKNKRNPYLFHHKVTKEAVLCIIKQETQSTDFDPHTLNYTFCQTAIGRRGSPKSLAHGMAQMTRDSFVGGRKMGILPLTSIDESKFDHGSQSDNFKLFKMMASSSDMQLEVLFRFLNNRVKAFGKLMKGVISYDQDRKSKYTRNFKRCMACFKKNKSSYFEDSAIKCMGGTPIVRTRPTPRPKRKHPPPTPRPRKRK
ncbi:MAG: hypothetical protein ISR65_18335 [Bacteriovoracaceae bacterium]|nr:hypothetical protein [Bacteriovoracaceae bacterium]